MKSPLHRYLELQLKRIDFEENGDSLEANRVRDAMDDHWHELTEEERNLVEQVIVSI